MSPVEPAQHEEDPEQGFACFATPERCSSSPREDRVLAAARSEWRAHPGGAFDETATRYRTYTWGEQPDVLLVHGWGGATSQLSAFIEPLRARGLGVLAFDAPAHGESPGTRTTLYEFVTCIQDLVGAHGRLRCLGHSLGATALMLAYVTRSVPLDRVVLVAPNDRLSSELEKFLRRTDRDEAAGAAIRELMRRRLVEEIWEETNLVHIAPRFDPATLVIHDKDDADVPFASSQELVDALPRAELFDTRGLGHRTLLRMPEVVERTVSALA